MPYTALQSGSDAAYPSGQRNYWKSHFVSEDAENTAWARELFSAMAPYVHGVYVNNLGTEGAERVKAAYAPAMYERLVALKDAYDPDNVFHLNQNVAPST